MKIISHIIKFLKITLSSVFLGACIASPVFADDIEIYTSLGPSAITSNPNIMFLVDTSGSMNTQSRVKDRYDESFPYAGICDSTVIYFTKSGFPDCTTSKDYFDVTANTCDHSVVGYTIAGNKVTPAQDGSLLLVGTYSDQFAQYDPVSKGWRELEIDSISDADRAYEVECRSDSGIHGETGAGNQDYIKDNVGWTNAVPADPANPHAVWFNSAGNVALFSGNYMNYLADEGDDPTAVPPLTGNVPTSLVSYMDQVKSAVEIMVRGNTRVDIGLMRFDSKSNQYEGGAIMYPILDVGADRNDFFQRLNNFTAGGFTPLSEALYEGLLYFGGKDVDYGKFASPSNQTGTTESGNPKAYQTPITSTCDLNYMVVLTDGEPTRDYINPTRQAVLPNLGSCNPLANGTNEDNCLPALAKWAFEEDIATRGDIPEHDGFQNLTTHTIAFGDNIPVDAQTLLQKTADASDDGEYFSVKNEQGLIEAFNDIIQGILAQNSTFSSPAVSVNAFNRSTNLDDLYFTLFKPTSGEHWEGNIKKFKLDFGPDINDFDGDGDTTEIIPFIADQNANPAIGADGFFLGTSKSFWTVGAADGPETAAGGAASLLDATPAREVYTVTGTYIDTNGVLTLSAADADLSNGNDLRTSNASVTDVMLGVAGFADLFTTTTAVPYRTALLDWAGGVDILANGQAGPAGTGARKEMGDPLHAEPALVQYGLTGTGDPDLVAYVATNDGYLHAIDTLDGTENFAFVPQEMLRKLDNIFVDSGANGKQYGLDGNVVPWIFDKDGDGTIKASDGDHVYLYFGMRRGGRYIYSLDVTDRNKPKLRWVISGGVGDYAELGQTWSTVNIERIKTGSNPTTFKTVLIFGGGYDTAQDSKSLRGIDVVGRSMYIVDADTGKMIWRAGPTGSLPAPDLVLDDMQYSMPARIKPLDIDGDGFVDRLYAGDMGGQLWRIDIDSDSNTTTSVAATGGRIADLAVDASAIDNRRFYYPPDAALIVQEGQAPFISIVAGSGYRAHPLNTTIHDRMYMIRDYDVFNVPTPYTTITEADLFDTTDNAIGEGNQTAKDTAALELEGKEGWLISLEELNGSFVGEKALAEPLILNGVAIITTFLPATSGINLDECKPNVGAGSIFFVNVADGTPTFDLSGAVDKTREDRKQFLARGGIPPSPTIIITEAGTPTLCVGTECGQAGAIGTIQKMYWYEK